MNPPTLSTEGVFFHLNWGGWGGYFRRFCGGVYHHFWGVCQGGGFLHFQGGFFSLFGGGVSVFGGGGGLSPCLGVFFSFLPVYTENPAALQGVLPH